MSSSSSNKRKASATTMGPPEGPSEKKARRSTPLETRLENLRETLADLQPTWEMCDPGFFMQEMRLTRTQIDGLDPTMIERFIATGVCDSILNALDFLDSQLLENSTPTGSQPVGRTRSYQQIRNDMVAYVELVRGGLKALVAQAQVKPTPTDFTDSKIWGVYQERANAILCLRPAHKKGLPIPLMHKVFCDFTRHLHKPTLDKHTVKYLTMADELCQKMPSAFESESARRLAFDTIVSSLDQDLTQHLEYPLLTNFSISNVKESGAMFVAKAIPYKGGSLVLMLEGFENEDGDGDIYMQICRAYEVLCEDPKVEPFNPVFLLCILGPYIMVCGAVKRENAHVEPLTPFLPMFPGYGIEGRPVQLAHCLRALKHGLDALRKFWRDVEATSDADKKSMIQRQHPNCPDNGLLCFDDWEGTFESPMDGKRNPDKPPSFLAKLRKADIEVQAVVKFVYNDSGKYGKDTHEYLHGLGLAPRLYAALDLHRGLVMVVMEHLAFQEGLGGWVELDTFEKRLDTTMADAVRQKLEKIIGLLREQRMVHADLRPKNIMVQVDERRRIRMSENEPVLYLIDFDWAGVANEVCYPPFLNPRIRWPPGAEAYGKVGGDDDRILLDNWWGAFVQPAGSS